MISQLSQYITKKLSQLGIIIVKLTQSIASCKYKLQTELTIAISKFHQLYQTNLELGIYHLKNGKIRDAILRFWLIDKFLKKNDQQYLYYLALSYWLNGNLTKASNTLSRLDNVAPLQDYLTKDATTIQEIPLAIWQQYRELTRSPETKLFNSYILTTLSTEIFNVIRVLPPACRILELGSTGFIGAMLHMKLSDNYYLTVVDEVKNYEENNIYHQVQEVPIFVFLAGNADSFDLIISYKTLAFTANLENYFQLIYQHLNTQGYFILVLSAGASTTLNAKRTIFYYNLAETSNSLLKTGFKVMYQRVHKIKQNNDSYLLIIAQRKEPAVGRVNI